MIESGDSTSVIPPASEFPEPDDAILEQGRLLFTKQCMFVLGAAKPEHIPATSLPEIAFAGRSNVGKSNLINAFTGHNSLARTSNTPGRTQEINFFNLGGRLMIADLPGFGYARAVKTRIKQWTHLVTTYLRGRLCYGAPVCWLMLVIASSPSILKSWSCWIKRRLTIRSY